MFLTLSVAIKKTTHPLPYVKLWNRNRHPQHSAMQQWPDCPASDSTGQCSNVNHSQWQHTENNPAPQKKKKLPHKGFMTAKHPAWLWLQLDFKSSFNFACTSKPFEPLDLKLLTWNSSVWMKLNNKLKPAKASNRSRKWLYTYSRQHLTAVPLSVKAWSPLSWILLKSSPPSMLQKQPETTKRNVHGLKRQKLLRLRLMVMIIHFCDVCLLYICTVCNFLLIHFNSIT